MKVILGLFLVSLSFQALAETSRLNFKCKPVNLHYINKFEMTGSFEVSDSGETVEENAEFIASIKERGFDTRSSFIDYDDLTLVSRKVKNQTTTKKSFYVLKYKSKKNAERKFLATILVDYPNKLNGSIKLDDGRVFKSGCTIL